MPRKRKATLQRVPPNFGTELGTAPRRAPVTAPLFQQPKRRITETEAYHSHRLAFAQAEGKKIERDRLSGGRRSALGTYPSPKRQLSAGRKSALVKKEHEHYTTANSHSRHVHQTAAQKEDQRHIAAGSKGALIKTERKNSFGARQHEARARLHLMEYNKDHAAAVLAKTGSESARSKYTRAVKVWEQERDAYRREFVV